MKTITFIALEEGSSYSLRPRSSSHPHHHHSQHQHTIKFSRREDIPLAIRMWFSLFGDNALQYSPFINSRSSHALEPGYTYVLRGRDNAEGAHFVRYRPGSRHQCINTHIDPRPSRLRNNGYDYDYDNDEPRIIRAPFSGGLRDFGPPDLLPLPPAYSFASRGRSYHPNNNSGIRRGRSPYDIDDDDDARLHDLERQLHVLKSRLHERHTSVPAHHLPPQPAASSVVRPRDKSPSSSSTSSNHSNDQPKTPDDTPDKQDKRKGKDPHETSIDRDSRKVHFANVEDHLEDMYEGPLHPSQIFRDDSRGRPIDRGGGGNSRWEDHPCYDDSQGGYGVVREPKKRRRYPGCFEI